MKQIPLTQGKFAIVDDEDFHYLSRFEWHAAINSNNDYAARRRAKLESKESRSVDAYISMASSIIPPKQYSEIGFKNHNTLDYRKENLIYVSYSLKRHRADKQAGKTSSKYKGVCFCKAGCPKDRQWSAAIYKRIDGVIRRFHLGYFSTQEKAARAYNQKSLELYGEDAYQNKIEE